VAGKFMQILDTNTTKNAVSMTSNKAALLKVVSTYQHDGLSSFFKKFYDERKSTLLDGGLQTDILSAFITNASQNNCINFLRDSNTPSAVKNEMLKLLVDSPTSLSKKSQEGFVEKCNQVVKKTIPNLLNDNNVQIPLLGLIKIDPNFRSNNRELVGQIISKNVNYIQKLNKIAPLKPAEVIACLNSAAKQQDPSHRNQIIVKLLDTLDEKRGLFASSKAIASFDRADRIGITNFFINNQSFITHEVVSALNKLERGGIEIGASSLATLNRSNNRNTVGNATSNRSTSPNASQPINTNNNTTSSNPPLRKKMVTTGTDATITQSRQ
jgi:hypothetical protein